MSRKYTDIDLPINHLAAENSVRPIRRFRHIGVALLFVLACLFTVTAQSQNEPSTVSTRIVPILFYLLDANAGSSSPLVAFDTPDENQVFSLGDPVAVNATASDSDGTIVKVDLYLDGVIVNSDIQAPYQWSGGVLNALVAGEHILRLVAVDNMGNETAVVQRISVEEAWITCAIEGEVCSVPGLATVRYGANGQYNILTDIETSVQCTNAVFGDPIRGERKTCQYRLQGNSVNQAPSVSFTAPDNNASFTESQSVLVTANANDSDGQISRVELRVDGGAAQIDQSAPFQWTVPGLSIGSHTLQLVSIDDDGAASMPANRSITITADSVNQSPTVGFTVPNNNQSFTDGDTVSVGVTANDSDGSVSRVDLYIDGVFDSSDNSAPYSWSVDNLTVGQHTLRAVATDDDGAESEVTISITVEEEVINPPNDNLRAGRPVLNVLRYRVAGTSGNAALDSGNFSNWNIVTENNASVDVAANNRSVTFSRNVANDGSNARAYIEFTLGPVWDDADLSVCMEVSGYDERNSGTRNVSLQVVGSHLSGTLTRTPTSNGIWCSVLEVTANSTTTVVRVGLGVTGNDTRTNALTVSNFSFSPTTDGLPNEYVAVQPQFSLPGNTTGWNGGVFNYDKSVSYNANTGETVFTVPGSVDNTPAASHVMSIFDSYGGFVSRATTRWLLYGVEQTPEYIMTNNARSGRALGDTYQTSLLDDMYAAAPIPKPGILLIRQAGNDLKVNAETAAQTDTYLQWHIDWAQANNMQVILTTATPFRGSSNWTQARQNQLEAYNDLVRARSGQAGITVIDEYALIDTNNDGQIDGDDDVPDSIDNGEGFASSDLVHATASGYRVLAQAHDAAIKAIINSAQPISSGSVNAVINPSRTECASPCTVVFSAEKTTAQGLDDHGIWSQLSYHWDFDTDESDTYGALYEQTYTYVDGDTAHESGHVPLVTKTFLCDTGTCKYNVGMRAQNAAGEYDDAFQTVTVHAESTEWSAANTICVSNTLSLAADWTAFDKACPAGATKQATIPLPDQFDGKLVLLRRGDVFDSDDLLDEGPNNLDLFTIQSGESNYKVSNFGDNSDSFPDIQGRVLTGVASYTSSGTTVTSVDTTITDADVSANGWTSNAYFEGLRLAGFIFPESFSHIGIHDIDADQENATLGGVISFSGGVRCTDHPTFLDCANVPFPKGGYISKTNIVGSDGALTNQGVTLNIGTTGCVMVNFTGMVDTQVRRVGEHNLRIAGWYRFNIMRSAFLGGHHTVNKAKITPRVCVDSALFSSQWTTRTDLPAGWQDDIEGRTRADIYTGTNDDYLHVSRYLTIAHNQIGSSNQAHWGTHPGGGKVGSGVNQEADGIFAQDAMISHNKFESEIDGATVLTRPDTNGGGPIPQDITRMGWYKTCVDNDYFDGTNRCYPSSPFASWNVRREPTPTTPPLKPGSL